MDPKEKVEEINRIQALYEEATSRFMNKCDVDVLEWLDADEQAEYRKLCLEIDGQCPFCGGDAEGEENLCTCEDVDTTDGIGVKQN